ncbi:hypothetical protein BUALT_Bualt11G0136800 [Buddleja alternifolia]|uniref:Uncharacterized protein n=1 Tax=Buddleja alternifolia TaxID=168488 RepID=A0AAV6WZM6_9LAMI|nr:hypothetical protein BUALT_Bualt11G0136800 [Buddleja alternifolia]
MLLLSMWLFWSLVMSSSASSAQSPSSSSSSVGDARALDGLLQGYAYRAFLNPRTGIVYDGVVPSNLTGIQISAMRLRSGSLKTRGVSMYKEFRVPKGVVEQPYVERLVFVYQNLGNWSMQYYPLQGYMYLAPVLGLLAYDASDLTAINLHHLDIRASDQPISVQFSELRSVPDGSVPKCVLFDLNGSINFSNVLSGNICTTFQQGHFSIVVESVAPFPSPSPSPSPSQGGRIPRSGEGQEKNKSRVWIIVGSVIGGFALLVMLGVLIIWVCKYKKRKNMHKMERAAEVGEALHMTTVGSTKAPAATVILGCDVGN